MKGIPSAALDAGLRRLWHKACTQMVDELALLPVALPPTLARAEGTLGDRPVIMHTRRYQGAQLAPLTVAVLEIDQCLCSLTVIGLPPAGSPGPVLGIDLIALRGTLSLVAIDLSPLDESFWSAHCSSLLAAVHTLAAPALVPRKRPEFAAEVFSPQALIAGARAGEEEAVLAGVEFLLARIAPLFERAATQGPVPGADSRLHRWLAAERRNRKEHNALAQLFGATFAAEYLDRFLFGSAGIACY